jgi:hypothetical protein
LFVWKDATRTAGVVYDLTMPDKPPRPIGGGAVTGPANARALLMSEQPLRWQEWVEVWERDQAGKPHEPLLPGAVLLPAA